MPTLLVNSSPVALSTETYIPLVYDLLTTLCCLLSDPETQLSRLMKRNDYTEEQARQRIATQMALDEKCQKATHVVDNSSTSVETLRQVETIHEELTRSWAFMRVRIAFAIIVSSISLACYLVVQLIW